MRLLLDTHALLWASVGSDYLSAVAKRVLLDPRNTLYVSPVSAWEAGSKHRQRKLPEADALFPDFDQKVRRAGYQVLAISCEHAETAAKYTREHRDPFDRMLAAQSTIEGLVLVSKDEALDAFGVKRIW